MEQRLAARDVAFDPAPDADDEDAIYSPSAYLPAPDSDPAVAIERGEWEDTSSMRLKHALSTLDERSRAIVERRWLRDDNKSTLHELAAEYSVSAERIRQIETNALKKLKTVMA
jgi:RNA polymerase sigma-32 factor